MLVPRPILLVRAATPREGLDGIECTLVVLINIGRPIGWAKQAVDRPQSMQVGGLRLPSRLLIDCGEAVGPVVGKATLIFMGFSSSSVSSVRTALCRISVFMYGSGTRCREFGSARPYSDTNE